MAPELAPNLNYISHPIEMNIVSTSTFWDTITKELWNLDLNCICIAVKTSLDGLILGTINAVIKFFANQARVGVHPR